MEVAEVLKYHLKTRTPPMSFRNSPRRLMEAFGIKAPPVSAAQGTGADENGDRLIS